jgi:hypothetical protein
MGEDISIVHFQYLCLSAVRLQKTRRFEASLSLLAIANVYHLVILSHRGRLHWLSISKHQNELRAHSSSLSDMQEKQWAPHTFNNLKDLIKPHPFMHL